ncbi:MAG: Unknown protein [uncultured Sulfurovum sp.]|uniref:Uncharacterized protein n=1 Tax=uncultured Sulfurovum sp. TaxID=269237 RepID=A0A6S6U3R7_9BACT|nr:MAG: Unknown protein [uncultured Sulfurovum sp.]
MRITLDVPNEQLFEKILWFLNRFKNDGVQIMTIQRQSKKTDTNISKLKQFEKLVNAKSKNTVKISEQTILNPHDELSNDIS